MAVEVRPIRDEELARWVEVQHIAFHSSRSAEDEAAYRRDVRGQELGRTVGAFDDGQMVGTYESFPAELSLPGETCVTANAVSSVSVLPTHHRRGLLRQMLTLDLQQARERGEAASILTPAEYPIYGRFGYGCAAERAEYVLERAAVRFTRAAPGKVELVTRERMREIAPDVFDRFRRAYPGQIDRRPTSWDSRIGLRAAPWRNPEEAPLCATYTSPEGAVEGYLLYRGESNWESTLPRSRLHIQELISLSGDAYLGLWRYCAEVDLVADIEAGMRSVEEPLVWLLDNTRAALTRRLLGDFLWVRALDLARFLAARRYACEARLVLEVSDPLGLSGGRVALEGSLEGATCRATSASADLSMSMLALGAISLGGVSLRTLAAVGQIDEHTPGAVDLGERLFRWPVTPWCSTFF